MVRECARWDVAGREGDLGSARRRADVGAGSAGAVEALEPRVLLAALVYDGLPAYFNLPGAVEPVVVDGSNDDLSFVFSSFETVPPTFTGPRPQTGYAVIDGVRTAFADIPGVGEDAYILGVNNAGLIVGAERGEGGEGEGFAPVLGRLFIVLDGVRVYIEDAAAEVIGGLTPDFSTLGAAEEGTPDGPLVPVGNDGSVLLHDLDEEGRRRAWLLKDGVLTFLWYGEAQDVNDAGAVLGTRREGDGGAVLLVRGADGELTAVEGLTPAQRVDLPANAPRPGFIIINAALTNLGEVYGQDENLRLAVWRDGVVTPLSEIPVGDPENQFGWVVTDADDEGRVIATYHSFQPPSRIPGDVGMFLAMQYRYRPEEGLRLLEADLWGLGGQTRPGMGFQALRLLSGDRMLLSTGVVTAYAEQEAWTLAPQMPIGATAGTVVGVSRFGDVIMLRRDGDAWSRSRVPGGPGAGSAPLSVRGVEVSGILACTDPNSGQDSFFILGPETLAWGSIGIPPSEGTTIPHRGATVFTASGNRVILAGVDDAGDLAIYYQTGAYPPDNYLNWNYDNLVRTHLIPQGVEKPTIASNLTGFSTPWGSDHIAFLDDAGDLHVVWIPPGGTQWQIVNLSEVSGAPALSGNLTSFVTPWHTLHFNAVDANGDVVAVWWAPGFEGQWLATRLFEGGAQVRLRPETITSFTTPWGALNIVGIDEQTGEVAVYWWAPATNQWAAERLRVEPGPGEDAVVPPAAELVGVSRVDGQDIFGRGEGGELAHLLWNVGDGAVWTSENLMVSAADPA